MSEGHDPHCSVLGIIENAKAEGASEALKVVARAYQEKVKTTDDPLVAFLYLLMRDYMTFGNAMKLINEVERAYDLRENDNQPAMPNLKHSGMAQLAVEMAGALRDASGEVPSIVTKVTVKVKSSRRRGEGGEVVVDEKHLPDGVTLCGLLSMLNCVAGKVGDTVYVHALEIETKPLD